jgi:uncharacterized protein
MNNTRPNRHVITRNPRGAAMSISQRVAAWFELPVANFERAQVFYEVVLNRGIVPTDMGSYRIGLLSSESDSTGGAIVLGAGYVPCGSGTIVYLDGGNDLSAMLTRVEQAGGTVVVPKSEIGSGFGYFAHFIDTEGNKVGLHSMG